MRDFFRLLRTSGPFSWSVDTIIWGYNISEQRIGMGLALIPCKNMASGSNLIPKVSSWGEDCPSPGVQFPIPLPMWDFITLSNISQIAYKVSQTPPIKTFLHWKNAKMHVLFMFRRGSKVINHFLHSLFFFRRGSKVINHFPCLKSISLLALDKWLMYPVKINVMDFYIAIFLNEHQSAECWNQVGINGAK